MRIRSLGDVGFGSLARYLGIPLSIFRLRLRMVDLKALEIRNGDATRNVVHNAVKIYVGKKHLD